MRILLLIMLLPLVHACTQQGTAQTEQALILPEAANDSAAAMPQTVAVADTAPVQQTEPVEEFTVEYLMGKFDPTQHPDFVKVDAKYADKEGHLLRKEAYENFVKMAEAAKAEGVTLSIVSATRNFERQRAIWEGKWTGSRLIENGANAAKKYPNPKTRALKILEYSSMPGSSRHHWGTDVDINDLDNYTFEKGPGKKVYDWMLAHAHEYGFCQPYTKKGEARPNGYNEEKWHWSYIPVAKKLTDLAARKLTDDMIGGFKGAETAIEIGVVEKYVLGINQECL